MINAFLRQCLAVIASRLIVSALCRASLFVANLFFLGYLQDRIELLLVKEIQLFVKSW